MTVSRRNACALLAASPLLAIPGTAAKRKIQLTVRKNEIRLQTGDAVCRFTRLSSKWAFDSVLVRGKEAARAFSRNDSFFLGSGAVEDLRVVMDSATRKSVRFKGRDFAATFTVDAQEHLPRFFIELEGPDIPICAWRTPAAAPNQRGAWVTRGETASDAEGREVFIDGSGRLVFGHSVSGTVDSAYVIQAELLDNLNRRGKSMQMSDTFFKSGRTEERPHSYFGYWQIRLGAKQPKRFGIVFDRDLGGRMHDVCEKYYASAVDSQADLSTLSSSYDPDLALEKMPLRLSCPESLIPQYGWHMEEYFPGYGKAAYPFGDEASGTQTGALLAYEGHATGREWEKNFGKYVIDQLPLWAESDGKAYFTVRKEGRTRWAYHRDYAHEFPFMEGGNWTSAEQLYWVAALFSDNELKQRSLDLMRHDVSVKLDLEHMTFPPCWNPVAGKETDRRDDWNTTACLGYCAELCSEILYKETSDETYLQTADRITDWLASIWGPEIRMNYLHPRVNTFHCWMGWLVRAMIHRYERAGDSKFLEIAQDLVWVIILTLCTTGHHDIAGRPLTGVTCVGVRGCVDYDCTPNLCQEKDQAFLQNIGPLLNHVSGAAYAKYIAMQKFVLPRDSWLQAFRIQEQRELNLRTNYDNFARGMTNLAFALNKSSDPQMAVLETLVSNYDTTINHRRDIVIANGTLSSRVTNVQIRFLAPGQYRVTLDGTPKGIRSAAALAGGLQVAVPANSTRALKVDLVTAGPTTELAARPGPAPTFLSDIDPFDSQRGTGLPSTIFERDRSFRGGPLSIGAKTYAKGLGLAANTVLVYHLGRNYSALSGTLGISNDAHSAAGPEPSANVTIFADGHCRFTSGPVFVRTAPISVHVDLHGADVLVVRVSSNWDDNGDYSNDMINFVDARLLGQSSDS